MRETYFSRESARAFELDSHRRVQSGPADHLAPVTTAFSAIKGEDTELGGAAGLEATA